MKQSFLLNMNGAQVTPSAVAKCFGATMLQHPHLPSDKAFFVDSEGEIVAVMINVGMGVQNG